MNELQLNIYRDFVPPCRDSNQKFLFENILNLLTFGIYGAYESISYQGRIRDLKHGQKGCLDKIHVFINRWKAIEDDIDGLVLQIEDGEDVHTSLEEEIVLIKENMEELLDDIEAFEDNCLERTAEIPSVHFVDTVWKIIRFMSSWLTSLAYLGIYRNDSDAKYRSEVLAEQNTFLVNKLNSISEEYDKRLRRNIQILRGLSFVGDEILNRGALKNETLDKRLGTVPPKFDLKGFKAEDSDYDQGIDDEQDRNNEWSPYAKRYNGLRTAAELFQAGFSFALEELFDRAAKLPDLYKINRSLGTPASYGAQAVYRLLAADWIKGGKLVDTCHGIELHLNNKGVKLVPSRPENVLSYQMKNGKKGSSVILHFKSRDDFTPSEEVLAHTQAARGIDPVSAKALYCRLSPDMEEHFTILLLEPAMDGDHPLYQKSLKFIESQSKELQDTISTLTDLITDMAIAFEAKFKQEFALAEWQKILDPNDFDLQPFCKEDIETVVSIPEFKKDVRSEDFQYAPWNLDVEILALNQENGAEQEDFLQLIMRAQEDYQIYFRQLKQKWLEHPMKRGAQISHINWRQIKRRYLTSHELIEEEGCLFSNLLAVLMTDSGDLTASNIRKLKKAMAAYLDNPEHSDKFEGAIRNDCNLSVEVYQDWLRGGNQTVDTYEMSTVHLEIAAYTLGVRIALFTPASSSIDFADTKGSPDDCGRMVPVEDIYGHYFGPPTEELFFMAADNGYSYFGLFPKLNIDQLDDEDESIEGRRVIKKLYAYWNEIEDADVP